MFVALRDRALTGWKVEPPDVATNASRVHVGVGAILPGCWPKAPPEAKREVCPADADSKAFVRCCPHWPWRWSEMRPCWTMTEPRSSTPLRTSLASAHASCAAAGMRLCSRNEVLSLRCCYAGHGVDHKLVWASADSCAASPRAAAGGHSAPSLPGRRSITRGDLESIRPPFLSSRQLPAWALPLNLQPSTPWRAAEGASAPRGRGAGGSARRQDGKGALDNGGARTTAPGSQQVRVALQLSGCLRGLTSTSATREKLEEVLRVLRLGWRVDVFCALEACSAHEKNELRAGGLERFTATLSTAGARVQNCTVVESVFSPSGHLREPYARDHPMVGKLPWPHRYNARPLVAMFWKLLVVGELRRQSQRRYALVWQSRPDMVLNGDAPGGLGRRFDWQEKMRSKIDWDELRLAIRANRSVFYSDDAPLDAPCTSDLGLVLSPHAADHLRLAWYGLAALHTYTDWLFTAERCGTCIPANLQRTKPPLELSHSMHNKCRSKREGTCSTLCVAGALNAC